MTKSNSNHVLTLFEEHYSDATTELLHDNPFQLLIATMLSAQCTDKQVNKVTPILFDKYSSAELMAKADINELECIIRSCGFYKTKSKNILNTCSILVDKYDGQVPEELDLLIKLPGVGRKTANVVISNAFSKAAIAVDTHVFRVSNRIGLAKARTVQETENQLMDNIPQEKWSKAHHWLIQHGRRICVARNPKCSQCFLTIYCNYYNDIR